MAFIMAFPSPAADYVERSMSLDEKFVEHPASTYFMRAGQTYWREGIQNGALLVVDSSLKPCDGYLLVCRIGDELRIKRYRIHPKPHLVNQENGKREEMPDSTGDYNVTSPVFGVITYIINDAHVSLIIARFIGGAMPPSHRDNPPTTASFLCAYRDTEHGCKSHAQIRRWHVPVALQ